MCRGPPAPRSWESLLVWAPDSWSKGCEFEYRQERRENFFLPELTLCADSYSVSVPPPVTAVARRRSRSFCPKCRWQVTPKTRIHPWPDEVGVGRLCAIQAQCGNLFGNELARNLSGNIRPQSSQVAEPLWTYPGIKTGQTNLHLKKKKAQAEVNGRTFSQNPRKRGKSLHSPRGASSSLKPIAHWQQFTTRRQASAPSDSAGRATDTRYQRLHSHTSNTHTVVKRALFHIWQNHETRGQIIKVASSSKSSDDEDDNLVLFCCRCWCCNVGEWRKGRQKKNGSEFN